jgi:4-diphosphocytidyl-2-C-methyl-D-erythritol kinase
MRRIDVKSPAKINLYLEIKRKREDNYHEIETLFQRISLEDTIRIKETDKNSLNIICEHPDVPQDSSNLAARAANLILKECKVKTGISIEILKKIPVSAGLGGGSSNAASVLKALNELFSLGLNREKLFNMGMKLGADVPFFMLEEPVALAHGIGDELKVLKNVPSYWYIIIYPKIKISTKWAYEHLNLSLTKKKPGAKILIRALKNKKIEEIAPLLYNDFSSLIGASYKEVQRVEQTLRTAGVKAVLLSGSGPSVFGICRTKGEAEVVKKRASKKLGDMMFFVCHSS